MRIALFTIGGRGDTEPFVALAARLARDGHQITLAARPDFADLAAAHGIPFAPLGHPYRAFMRGSAAALGSGNPISLVRYGLAQRRYFAERVIEDEWRAAQGAEAIVFKYSWFAGYSLAEKLQVPCLAAMPFPMTPTGVFPCFWLFGGHDRGRWVNRLLWRLSEQVAWQIQRSEDERLRRELLDLPRLPLLGPVRRQEHEGMPVLYAYSPTLLPRPADWPSRFHVTGAWFLDSPPGWQPPPDVVAFLEAGPTPVYVGFGSMTSADPDATLALILDALARAGQRAVLLHGWAGLATGRELPDTVIAVDEVPHSWLFPRMAAVVHHGGAGTTVAGLRAGIPSVVTPLTADQPSWGRIVHRLGAGPRPIPFRHLTATRLSRAIAAAVSDPAIRERAAELGERIRAEDGVSRAVELFLMHVGR
jgi:UDP:flavonoid glycosyltransferase YjiC (YdhE family)